MRKRRIENEEGNCCSFLNNLKTRALGHIGIGGVGAIIGILFIIRVASQDVFGTKIGMDVMDVIGNGVYAYIIGSIITVIGGGIELKEG